MRPQTGAFFFLDFVRFTDNENALIAIRDSIVTRRVGLGQQYYEDAAPHSLKLIVCDT